MRLLHMASTHILSPSLATNRNVHLCGFIRHVEMLFGIISKGARNVRHAMSEDLLPACFRQAGLLQRLGGGLPRAAAVLRLRLKGVSCQRGTVDRLACAGGVSIRQVVREAAPHGEGRVLLPSISTLTTSASRTGSHPDASSL